MLISALQFFFPYFAFLYFFILKIGYTWLHNQWKIVGQVKIIHLNSWLSLSKVMLSGAEQPQCSSVVIRSRSKSMCTLKVLPISGGVDGRSRDSVFKNCIYVAGHPSGDEFSDTLLVLRSPDRQVTNKTCCH